MDVNKSLSNLAILLILRRSFHWCRRFCPNLLMSKVEKKWKGLLDVCWQKIRTAACASNSNTSNINSNISRTVPRPFLSYWRGEFAFKSKYLILSDHLLYCQDLFVWHWPLLWFKKLRRIATGKHVRADLGGGCRGCAPPPPRWPAVF